MTADELKAEIALELNSLRLIVAELNSLNSDLQNRAPSVREKTAGAAFLAQFYSGIENILKRLSRFHGATVPAGENWHVELFKRFCSPPHLGLPVLFDEGLARQLGAFRRFRHIVHHGYGFQIEWDRMREGVQQTSEVFAKIETTLISHLNRLQTAL